MRHHPQEARQGGFAWTATPAQTISKPGPFTAHIDGLSAKGKYEFRAVIHHPLLALYGAEIAMER